MWTPRVGPIPPLVLLTCLPIPCRSFQSITPATRLLSLAHGDIVHQRSNVLMPSSRVRRLRKLITSESDHIESTPGAIQRAIAKFKARPGTYLIIPCVASIVGFITNWMAVQMIFCALCVCDDSVDSYGRDNCLS